MSHALQFRIKNVIKLGDVSHMRIEEENGTMLGLNDAFMSYGDYVLPPIYFLLANIIEDRSWHASEDDKMSRVQILFNALKLSRFEIKRLGMYGKMKIKLIDFILQWPFRSDSVVEDLEMHMAQDVAAAKCLEWLWPCLDEDEDQLIIYDNQNVIMQCIHKARPECLNVLLKVYPFTWTEEMKLKCARECFHFPVSLLPFRSGLNGRTQRQALTLGPELSSRTQSRQVLLTLGPELSGTTQKFAPTYSLQIFLQYPLENPSDILELEKEGSMVVYRGTLLHYLVQENIFFMQYPAIFADVLSYLIEVLDVNISLTNEENKTALQLFEEEEEETLDHIAKIRDERERVDCEKIFALCKAMLTNGSQKSVRQSAVMMSLHPSLGAGSDLGKLGPDLLKQILSHNILPHGLFVSPKG